MLINIIKGYTNIKYLGVDTFVKQISNKYICNSILSRCLISNFIFYNSMKIKNITVKLLQLKSKK